MAKIARNYFFWNGKLHKVLRINRPANLVEAWSFARSERVIILRPDFRAKAKKAVTTSEAAKILGCSRYTIYQVINNGGVHPPPKSILPNQDPLRSSSWWSEEMLLELHDFLMDNSRRGTPRKQTANNYATKAEISAKMNDANILYVKDENGGFTPVYDPPKF